MEEVLAKKAKGDEDEFFALSLVAVLRRMDPKQKSVLKVKIMQDLSDVEFGKFGDSSDNHPH